MRPISLTFAAAMLGLGACAHAGADAGPPAAPAAAATGAARSRSPGGRHVVDLARGAIVVDGRQVRAAQSAQLLVAPTWRADGDALAWMERAGGETRLVVLTQLSRRAE